MYWGDEKGGLLELLLKNRSLLELLLWELQLDELQDELQLEQEQLLCGLLQELLLELKELLMELSEQHGLTKLEDKQEEELHGLEQLKQWLRLLELQETVLSLHEELKELQDCVDDFEGEDDEQLKDLVLEQQHALQTLDELELRLPLSLLLEQ